MYDIPNNIVIYRAHRIGFGDDRYRDIRLAKDGPHGFTAHGLRRILFVFFYLYTS